MSLEKHYTWEVACDSCPEAFDTDEKDFHAAIEAIKREGWRIRKVKDEWEHTCPVCVEDEKTADF